MEIVSIFFLSIIAHAVSHISRFFHLGAGATWPGEVALQIYPDILGKLTKNIKYGVILIAGTNGKTTTSKMIKKILTDCGFQVVHNASGANLENGLVSSLLDKPNSHWAVLETDEGAIPIVLNKITPRVIILLNLFRDQLDRYGEVDLIAEKWMKALKLLDQRKNQSTTLIINADDPHLALIGESMKNIPVYYFGLSNKKFYRKSFQHATDTIYCPRCGQRLFFSGIYFSHLGEWMCDKCLFKHPSVAVSSKDYSSPLDGIYNIYNTLAAALTGKILKISEKQVHKSLSDFAAAFGRMEDISYKGKKVKILLSKNPTGFNESLHTVLKSKKKGPILLVLNDRIPDGHDISWIWDVDFEELSEFKEFICVSGDRCYDLGLRLKYAVYKKYQKSCPAGRQVKIKNQKYLDIKKIKIVPVIKNSISEIIKSTRNEQTLWILATYTAMLEVRKFLTGKKIL